MQKYHKNSLLCRSKLTILLYGRRQLLHLLRVTLYMTYEADLRKMLWAEPNYEMRKIFWKHYIQGGSQKVQKLNE